MAAIIGSLRAELSANVAKFQQDMGKAADAVRDASKQMTVVGNEFRKVGAQMQSVGLGLTKTLTVPLLGLGVAVGKVAIDFDEAFDTIRAGTGATGQALAGLSQSFKNVFAVVPNGLHEVADAITEVHQRTGLVGKPLEEMATQLLNIARLTKTNVSDATSSATRLFGDWSIATEKQAASLDLVFRASQQTGIGFQRLSELVVQFGAPMRALGFSFEQTAALMGKFEKEGVNLETVMAGLRFSLGKFAAAGKEPAQAFADVAASIKGAKSESEATEIAFTNFGRRAAVDLSRAIRENRFDIDGLVQSLVTSQDTINKSAADTLSFSEKVTNLGHALAVALEPLGSKLVSILETQFVPAAKSAAEVVGNLVDAFLRLPDWVQKAVFAFAGFAALGGPVLFVGGQIVSSVSSIILAFGKAGIATRAILGTLNLLKGAEGLGGLATAFSGAAGAAGLFSTTIVGLGIAAAVIAISVAIRGLYADLDALSMRGTTGGPLKGLKDGFGNAIVPIGEVNQKLAEFGGVMGQTVPQVGGFIKVSQGAGAALTETGKAAAEATGPTKQFVDAVKELVAKFSGAGLLNAARQYEAALKGIGGTSKLSIGELHEMQAAFQAVIDKYQLIGPPGAKVVAHFQALLASLTPIPKAARDVEFGVSGLSDEVYTLGTTLKPSAILPLEAFDTTLKGLKANVTTFPTVFSGAKDAIQDFRDEEYQAAHATLGFREAMERLAEGSIGLGRALKSGLVDVLGRIPQTIVSAITGGGGLRGAAQAIGSMFGAFLGESLGTSVGKAIGLSLETIGKIAGPIGAAIGALVGPLIGKIADALTTSPGEYAMKEVGKKWGVQISEGLGDEIAKTATDLRDELAASLAAAGDLAGAFAAMKKPAKFFDAEAEVVEIKKIIEAAGGLNDVNISKLTGQLRNVFVFLGQGTLSLSRATKVLDENFQAFANHFIENGKLISKELVEIIHLDEQFGTQSKAIADFVGQQSSRIASGIQTFLNNITVTSQQTANGISAAIGAAFAGMQRAGLSLGDILRQLSPLVEDWAKKLQAAGLKGSDAFNEVLALAQIMKDEFAGPIIEGVNGLGDALAGLHNTGLLTQETFSDLSETIVQSFQDLIAKGVDGTNALRLMQPALQVLWELMHDFGYEVSAGARELLDLAAANGIVGEQAKPVQQQMLDATNEIRDAVEALAHALGATLPKDAERAKQAMQEAARKAVEEFDRIPRTIDIDINVRTAITSAFETAVATTLATGSPIPGYQHGSDGLQDFGHGTLAMLHGREAVFTEAQLAGLARGGSTVTIAPQLYFSDNVEWLTRDRIRNEIAPEIIKAIRLNEHDLQTVLFGM